MFDSSFQTLQIQADDRGNLAKKQLNLVKIHRIYLKLLMSKKVFVISVNKEKSMLVVCDVQHTVSCYGGERCLLPQDHPLGAVNCLKNLHYRWIEQHEFTTKRP